MPITSVPKVSRRSWKRRLPRPAGLYFLYRAAVEVAAGLPGEDEVVVAGPVLALAESGECRGDVAAGARGSSTGSGAA
jgi:hypothetical protein